MRFGRLILPVILGLALAVPALGQKPQPTAPAILTLAVALDLALQHNPSLAASAEEIRARDAAARQAGLPPNPELRIEVENFAGEDELQGFDGAETTLALSQLFELGGKRGKRRKSAALETKLAEWDHQSRKLDVLTTTRKAFIRVLKAQRNVKLTRELVELAEKTLAAVTARVDAGKVQPVEAVLARVELAAARTEFDRAGRELQAARGRLAASWGAPRADYDRAVGELAELSAPPAEDALLARLEENPDLARLSTVRTQRRAELSLALAQAAPDLTLSLGVRNLRDPDSNALVAGLELPLPVFDRNQGGIGQERANLEKTRREARAARIETRAVLVQVRQELAAAYAEAVTLREEILPGARSAFEASEYGYREGKFGFLQMLEAQRTLFEVRGRYLLALSSYHQARAEVERLIGGPLHNLPKPAAQSNHDPR